MIEIGNEAFKFSGIKCLRIPAHLKKIEYGAFYWCRNFQLIEIDERSELRFFDENISEVFCNVKIFIIPIELSNRFKSLYIKFARKNHTKLFSI